MAAPPEKTLEDLSGIWIMSRHLSDDFDPILALQGVSWLKRKALSFATVTINVEQSTNKHEQTCIEIEQLITGGIKNKESRTLDGEYSLNNDETFGLMKGRSKWIKSSREKDSEWGQLDYYLKEEWPDETLKGSDLQKHIYTYATNEKKGWHVEQVWGFAIIHEKRYYVRRLVAKKGNEILRIRLVYEWIKKQ